MHMPVSWHGYDAGMGIVNRIITAILTVVTAPFRAIAGLFAGRGRRRT
jgi:hypothetical protein